MSLNIVGNNKRFVIAGILQTRVDINNSQGRSKLVSGPNGIMKIQLKHFCGDIVLQPYFSASGGHGTAMPQRVTNSIHHASEESSPEDERQSRKRQKNTGPGPACSEGSTVAGVPV